jgi:hypothetical protein
MKYLTNNKNNLIGPVKKVLARTSYHTPHTHTHCFLLVSVFPLLAPFPLSVRFNPPVFSFVEPTPDYGSRASCKVWVTNVRRISAACAPGFADDVSGVGFGFGFVFGVDAIFYSACVIHVTLFGCTCHNTVILYNV